MKLNTAIRIAKDCGLTTVGEAITNIKLHSSSIFSHDGVDKQITELEEDFKNSGKSINDKI